MLVGGDAVGYETLLQVGVGHHGGLGHRPERFITQRAAVIDEHDVAETVGGQVLGAAGLAVARVGEGEVHELLVPHLVADALIELVERRRRVPGH